jgi:hypothetical protein
MAGTRDCLMYKCVAVDDLILINIPIAPRFIAPHPLRRAPLAAFISAGGPMSRKDRIEAMLKLAQQAGQPRASSADDRNYVSRGPF